MKNILLSICLFFLLNTTYGQDTIFLEKKPTVILRSWYPENKKFPKLKIGESKILFTVIPDFKKTSIRNNDIDLKTSNSHVKIEETEKTIQYLITVNPTNEKFIEFELWLAYDNKTILLRHNSKWENITKLYPIKKNRILIDKIKLEVTK